jgi:DNA-binding FadR family transcriptional regulator
MAIKKKNLSELVAAKIKDYILEKSLSTGDRLPTEQEFAELFGVSRTCIREATKALSFLGIIHSAPRQGLTVGKVDMQRVTDYLGFHMALNNYPREQLLKTRLVLELGAMSETSRNLAKDAGLVKKLLALNNDLKKAETTEDFIRGDVAFHQALLEASQIEPLIAFNELMQVFFKRFQEEVSKGQWRSGILQHEQIVRLLREGKIIVAERILRTHLEYYRESAKRNEIK